MGDFSLLFSSSFSMTSSAGMFVGGASSSNLVRSLGGGGFIGPFVFVEKVG